MSLLPYLINITGFVKKYDQVIVQVDDLIIRSRITIIIGDNGCGKSTLLKAISNLISYEGHIDCQQDIKYMPEKNHFPYDATVYQFLSVLCHLNQASFDQLMELVILFQLEARLNEKLSKLSKGMKAKIDLINTLNNKAEIYLLDEPLNGLDEKSVSILIDYMRQSDKCFVIASHHLGLFSQLEAEVIALWNY